ncbi:MAG TPA: hypothetical protein PKW55_08685 [Spirochaetota bacterium]|nr:hypothetical protein [Spirochaetota bacterium]HOM39154.1 hypothetical protein [Spirochaetota bacterium]HPQ48331.1 hypothetical protein [Spirochaetota bacterium]
MKKLFLLFFIFFLAVYLTGEDSRLIEVKTIEEIEKELRENIEKEKEIEKKEEQDIKEEKENKRGEEIKEGEDDIKESKKIKEENKVSFNGKLYREDIFVQDMDTYFIVWIKKKEGVGSVGFITYERYTKKKMRYFFRAEEFPFKIDNRLKYKNNLIESGFLINSETDNHLFLGESFKIFLPKKIIIGYNSDKKYLTINENTNFIIRVFSQPFGEGSFYDNIYRLSLVYNSSIGFEKGLNVLKRSKKDEFNIIEVSYLSTIPDIKEIGLELNNEYYQLLPNRVNPETKIIIYNWGYKPGRNRFFMNFFIICKSKEDFYIVLKKDKDDIKLKIENK